LTRALGSTLLATRSPAPMAWSVSTNLRFSTAYHPQTDGLSERTIRTVIDTLRCCLDSTHEPSAKTEYEVLTEQIAQ